ncbi:MAG: GNAT family N-acetyltransferase, partial [Promethearchaeota archaeon]
MNTTNNIESLKFEPLHEDNIKAVHEMCNKNVQFLNHTFQTFKTTTIESKSFDPELTIIASDFEGKITAFFMVVFRRSQVFKKKRKVAVLKFFVVSKEWRYKGLGTKIYLELYKRIKGSEDRCFRMKFEVMSSV